MKDKDKDIPQSIGGRDSEPIYFPRKEEVCRRLDEFYRSSGVQKDMPPSSMFVGALYGMRKENRDNNPDWMAQVSHSLREIFYKLGLDWASAFKNYGSTFDERSGVQEVGKYKNLITQIAHHNFEEAQKSPLIGGSEDNPVEITEVFESIVLQFGDIVFAVLRRQIDAHREIDQILKKSPDEVSLDHIKELTNLNPDARQYFFSKADERWLGWLWQNGFLDVIKRKTEDPTRYGYRTPELNYLVRMAEKAPAKVVGIMFEVPISPETFNPEVIDRFLHICNIIPADQLARMAEKICDGQWIPLMGAFNQWGFEYAEMLKTLAGAEDYESLLTLAEAVLAVRTKEEIEKSRRGFTDNPFYFDDLSYAKVFEYLANVGDDHAERALGLASKVMAKVIALWSKEDEGEDEKVFKVYDKLMLLDVDFFALELGQKDRLSARDNVRELAAVIKVLTMRLIGERCAESEKARQIYKQYIDFLPDSRAMWRLRLFVLSLCPEVFKEELKDAFSRLFKVIETEKSYYEIESGTEYKKVLKKSFGVLENEYQREYVENVFKYFGRSFENKKKEQWYERDGWQILSSISDCLIEEEHKKCEEVFGRKRDPNFEPEPSIGKTKVGYIVPRGPITKEEFEKLPITNIAQKLRNEWMPEALRKQNTSDDFLNPLNAEGVGELLRNDISKRLQEYIDNATSFFERGVLNQHYTYSYLRGIQETIKNHREETLKVNWDSGIALFIAIKDSGGEVPFEREKRERDSFDVWLAGWDAVHSAMADVLQELLTERGGSALIDFGKYRDRIFAVLKYLLSYPDPTPAGEQIETAKSKTKSPGDEGYMASDPFTIAVNTVRGRTYQAFTLFVYQDGKQFKREDKEKIAADVKKLYEIVLKNESTRALMFMFGYYLPTFYFRDRDWVRGLLSQIFPQEPERKYLYTAAWEGYLANNLYEEMFFEPEIQKLYERGLALTDADFPKQKHFREPDEGMAVHLALAYMHYKKFGFGHALFDTFWKKNDPEQHANFVSFLGRSFVSGDNANANELLKKEPESKKQLKDFWDWMLENYKDSKPFVEFGFWINLKKDIYELVWLAEHVKKTLEKTKGSLGWDYGLMKTVVRLAQEAPRDTLEITRQYLLESGVRGDARRRPLYLDNEWTEALKILYENPETKPGTCNLIDELIREGGSTFWNLKEMVDNKT